ncbi:MAG: hypothetical protein JSU94_00975 [Phycisphaerales bacterium]|nr:MAG: hypothetical protein JSU94_00975 [Phycisphaerales bacterium]
MKPGFATAILVSLICCRLVQASNPADINNDRRVDWKDFAVFADNWLWTDPNVPDDMVLIPGATFPMGASLIRIRMKYPFTGSNWICSIWASMR